MCGIAGIFGWKGNAEELSQRLHAMEKALFHRGPDDHAIWTSDDGTAGLSHTRLSILDLSEAGHQPMGISSGEMEIAFNGEIYNFWTLRQKLEAAGIEFHSTSDTEVILFSFQQYGKKCLDDFDGMYAFAIYDSRRKQGFLARDPFGIKPLYYHYLDGRLVFASEVRTLLASGLIKRKLCQRAVDGFLRCGSVQEPDSLIEGVKHLPAGSCLTWTESGITVEKFAPLEFPSSPADCDAREIAKNAFQNTIRRHLVSDVPVGIFLSGGIDSSCIAKAVCEQTSERLHTFSIAVEDENLNEAPLARQFAKELGTIHHEYLLSEENVPALFDAYVAAMDQPSIDGFNTYCVSRFARENGAKVVLSGLGGDEIFGGYGSFDRVPRLLKLSERIRTGAAPLKILGKLLDTPATSPKLQRAGEWMQKEPSLQSSYHFIRSVFSRARSARLQCRLGWERPEEWIAPAPPAFPDPRDQVSYMELCGYMKNQLLRDSDVMSMAHGLELRVPLVDWEFFRMLSNIPPTMRFASGKRLLVDAAGGLPEWITERPKRGFLFPYQKWISRLWRTPRFSEYPIQPVENGPWYQGWAVVVLQDWMRRHKVET